MTTRKKTNKELYIASFLITSVLFIAIFALTNYFNNKKIAQIRQLQESISLDILSLETQFDLLAARACEDITENSVLSAELAQLARRLSHMEAQLGTDDPEVLRLKRFYSLLEVKDLLLMQQVTKQCQNIKPVVILYFYSNRDDCPQCQRQGYILTALARQYPQLRIYSFDYHLDLSVIKTLISIYHITDQLPALVIDGTVYQGFQSMEDIKNVLPELAATSTAATSSAKQK